MNPRRSGSPVLLVALLILLAGRSAWAGTPPLPDDPDLTSLSPEQLMAIDVVYGASKYQQKVSAAPSSVTVLTAEEIERYGYTTLADILAAMRGVYTTYDRNYSFVGVRGFQRPSDYNLRTLLLVDGHRINDSIYNTALIGTEGVVNVDDIERVELIRGPSSSIYGAGAFFAVINVITKRGVDHPGFEASGSGASYRTESGRLAYGARTKGGTDLFISGSGSQSDGQDFFFKEFNDPADNNGRAEDVDADRNIKGLARVSFGHLTIEAAHSRREKVIPTAPYGTVFNSPENRTLDERSYLDLKYERPMTDRANLLARVYADRYYYAGRYFYTPGSGGLYTEHATAYTRGFETQYTFRANDRNVFVTGGEYRDHFREDFRADDDLAVYSDAHRTDADWGVFLQDDASVSERVALHLGARYDDYLSFGGNVSPRFGLIVSPRPGTALKALLGRSFRAPSIFELHYGNGANPDLDPEKIVTGELILEHTTPAGLRFTAGLFRNQISDLISLGPGPLFVNIDGIVSKGIETELERSWKNGVRVNFNYAFQDTTRDDGTRFDNSPHHLAKLRFDLPFFDPKLFLGTEVHYTSRRGTLAGNEVGGFTLLNLTFLRKNLVRGLDLSAGFYNVLNRTYYDPAASMSATLQDAIEQNGRNVRLKLVWRF